MPYPPELYRSRKEPFEHAVVAAVLSWHLARDVLSLKPSSPPAKLTGCSPYCAHGGVTLSFVFVSLPLQLMFARCDIKHGELSNRTVCAAIGSQIKSQLTRCDSSCFDSAVPLFECLECRSDMSIKHSPFCGRCAPAVAPVRACRAQSLRRRSRVV